MTDQVVPGGDKVLPQVGSAVGGAVDRAVSAIDGVVPEVDSPANEALADRAWFMPWLGLLFGVSALVLIPWVFYLGMNLPARQLSSHYALAWAGFDVGLCFALASTAYAIYRRAPWVGMSAGATAALLVTDAWFDVVTSPTMSMTMQALLMAVVVELPLAALCIWLCRHADQLADRRIRVLLGRGGDAARRS